MPAERRGRFEVMRAAVTLHHGRLAGETAAARAQEDWLLLMASALLAVQAELQGRLAACERAAAEALELAAERGWSRTWPAGAAQVALAAVSLHWNRLDDAEASLEQADRCLRGSGDPPLRAMLAHHRAGLLVARGDPDGALRVAQQAAEELDRWPLAAELRGLLVGREAVLLAAVGRAAPSPPSCAATSRAPPTGRWPRSCWTRSTAPDPPTGRRGCSRTGSATASSSSCATCRRCSPTRRSHRSCTCP